MSKRPSIKEQNIGVFFGKSKHKKSEPRKKEGMSKKLAYQEKWKKEGKVQIALWIPKSLVKEFKIQAIREDKNTSELAADIFSKAFKTPK